ncbi:MAG TPA: FAD:protein FMN transferase [Bdellovibrionota bacterium]|nr:FAD:protein FMN transferase [Bdellovibrionota bacterium]
MDAFLVRRSENHMATTFEFVVSVPAVRTGAAERILAEAHREAGRLERCLSEFIADSDVGRLNAAPPGVDVAVGPDCLALLALSARINRQTGGAFDCTAKTPGDVSRTGRLTWDTTQGTARRGHEAVRVGFGAIGKGYALDRVRLLLESEGMGDYLLVAGGSSIVLSGFAARGRPWTWMWGWTKDADGKPAGRVFSHASGAPVALGVSGTQEQGLHVLDPASGRAADVNTSALIAHPSAAAADALSTALFVLGWEKGFDRMADDAAVPGVALLDGRQVPRWNGVFQRLWGPLDETPAPYSSRGSFTAVGLTAAALLAPALVRTARAEDEAVDLGALGLNDFNPYMVERHSAWILLPLLMIGMVCIHLIRPKRRARLITKATSNPSKGATT